MAIPEVIQPRGLADYLAVMSRAIFQAGMSWKLIDSKWDAYLRLFEDFDPLLVAAFGEGDVERIITDGGVLRTYKKLAGTVENARTLLALDREFGGFKNYLRSFGSYGALAADLKVRFAFLGELSAYYFLFRVGEPVPRFEQWEQTVPGDHPRMREMVALARARGTSSELPCNASASSEPKDTSPAKQRKR
ncbi:MAG: DNA-3-methyladenine glycosylase I [Vulcanimicrobiaceae bacterium]